MTPKNELFEVEKTMFSLKLSKELLIAFQSACAKNETSASVEIRKFMQKYVKEN